MNRMSSGYTEKESYKFADPEEDNIFNNDVEEIVWGEEPWEWVDTEMTGVAFDPIIDVPKEYVTQYEQGFLGNTTELSEALRHVLHEDYINAPPEEMEEALGRIMGVMTPAERLNFTNVLSRIMSNHYQSHCGCLPNNYSELSSNVPMTLSLHEDGSVAAAQLLQLFQNPEVLKSLTALSLGSYGRESIRVGKLGQAFSLGEFMNMLDELVSKIVLDVEWLVRKDNQTPSLRLENNKYGSIDSAIAEDRTQMLYDVLISGGTQRLSAETNPQKPWSNFFPFKKGTKLLVEYEITGPDPNIGHGKVIECTSNLLKVKIHINKWDLFNVPETDVLIEIEYIKEGSGNRASIKVNGQNYRDNNVTIRSEKKTRWLSMSISILGYRVDRIAVTKEDSEEAKLKFKAGGDEHVLVLTRK